MFRIPRKLKKLYKTNGWELAIGSASGTIYGRDKLRGGGGGGWVVISRPKGFQ